MPYASRAPKGRMMMALGHPLFNFVAKSLLGMLLLTDNLVVSPFNTRSRYSCLISLSSLLGRPGYMVLPPDSTICL